MADFFKANPSLAVDGILLLIIIIYAIKGYLDGLISSVISLVGNLGSLVAAGYVSRIYPQQFFDTLLRKSMIERSYNYLVETSRAVDVKTAVTNIIGKAPGFLVEDILTKAQDVITQILEPSLDSATYLVDDFIRPIIVPCIAIVMFVLVFIAVKVVCSMLASLFKKMNDVPILGTANKMTGFVIGIAIGCINIILLSFLLSIIILVTGDSLTYLNSGVVAGSRILAVTGIINPFLP